MTIEQEFFETFGIERITCSFIKNNGCCGCEIAKNYSPSTCPKSDYPPITPETVLRLENVIAQWCEDKRDWYYFVKFTSAYSIHYSPLDAISKELMCQVGNNALLKLCIQLKDEIQDQVKALFNA